MTVTPSLAPLVKYSISDAEIAKLRDQYAGLTCQTPDGYESVRLAIAETRGLRVAVEKRRVELKADALAFGRSVDAEAGRLTSALSAIETPLKLDKDTVDAEKERLRQAAIEAKRLEMEATLRAERAAEEAQLKAVRDAEEARLADERAALAAERLRLDEERRLAAVQAAEARAVLEAQARHEEAERAAERRKVAAEREAEDARQRIARQAEEDRQRAERDAIEQDRRVVAAEREQVARLEFERQAQIKAEADAASKVERDRVESAKREAEIAALLPDVDKARAFVAVIRAVVPPKVKSKRIADLLACAVADYETVSTSVEKLVAQMSARRVNQ